MADIFLRTTATAADVIIGPAAIDGETGTLGATEASDAASFAGSVAWAASLSAVDPSDSAAVSGLVGTIGTLAATESGDHAAFTGQVYWAASVAASEVPDQAAVAGLAGGIGALAAVEAQA